MKKRLLLAVIPVALAALACSGGASATDPTDSGPGDGTAAPGRAATSEPATVTTRLGGSDATATPVSSSARPAPTSRPAVATPVPTPTSAPRPVTNAPRPQPTATRQPTATPIRFDPHATATPLWVQPPRVVPTATTTPTPSPTEVIPPTVVAAAPQDRYQPLLNFQYELPARWTEVSTESSLVLYDESGGVEVTITEQVIEPWKYPTALALGAQLFPDEPDGWDNWSLVTSNDVRGTDSHEFQYSGQKQGVEYLNFIRWYLWGDAHVQVSVDVSESNWRENGRVRTEIGRLFDSFDPHDDSKYFTEAEALQTLALRLDDRRSGIFARDEVVKARYELTCHQIFTDLLGPPLYFGDGLWQMSAETLTGVERWRVFEPAGSIVALDTNESLC